nr:MAG TPA: hypothetical protein [Caudoviricetes sp.]
MLLVCYHVNEMLSTVKLFAILADRIAIIYHNI